MELQELLKNVKLFEVEAHRLFQKIESSPSRVLTLDTSYDRLKQLSIQQDDLVRQSFRCVKFELFRAAHVMCFAALMDYLEEYAGEDSFVAINAAYPKWNILSVEDFRERIGDFAIIDAMKKVDLIAKTMQKGLHALLTRRNECAHPGEYYPDLNMTLGYIAEALHRFEQLEKKRGR